jgi:hypothetical protein
MEADMPAVSVCAWRRYAEKPVETGCGIDAGGAIGVAAADQG